MSVFWGSIHCAVRHFTFHLRLLKFLIWPTLQKCWVHSEKCWIMNLIYGWQLIFTKSKWCAAGLDYTAVWWLINMNINAEVKYVILIGCLCDWQVISWEAADRIGWTERSHGSQSGCVSVAPGPRFEMILMKLALTHIIIRALIEPPGIRHLQLDYSLPWWIKNV